MRDAQPGRDRGTVIDLDRVEGRTNRLAWFCGIAVSLVTVSTVALLLVVKAQEPWEFALYPILGGVPLAYAIFSTFVNRKMQLDVLHRYQAQLVFEMTDLKDKAYRDELTGLYNRRHFHEAMQTELAKAHATKQPLAILIMDVDGLKTINDEYGHRVGDIVLANLGRVISRHVRIDDAAARLGGDEFGVIMPDTDKRGAFGLAERLAEDLSKTAMHIHNGEPIVVRLAMGLAGFPWGGETLEEMLQWADADMYANKLSNKLPSPAAKRPPRDAQDKGR
jgi:diguanylate cyclase (GGDEF)-like protein